MKLGQLEQHVHLLKNITLFCNIIAIFVENRKRSANFIKHKQACSFQNIRTDYRSRSPR